MAALAARVVAPSEPKALPEPQDVPLPPAPAPATSGGWSLPRTTPLDLGIGTYWKSVASSDAPIAPVPEPQPVVPPPRSPDRILRDGLDAHDRELGLGTGGPLVSAAHDAASASIGPDVGSATFEVESDATGRVIAAHVLSASADIAAWNDVARELVRLMGPKTLHAPRDSRGMRTRLRIVAERALPSGGHYTREGTGVHFDVADIGAKAARLVRVQLLGDASL
jgi:hypothetical protein